jgi:hypothetical protein
MIISVDAEKSFLKYNIYSAKNSHQIRKELSIIDNGETA